uniref:NAD(P)/FAD-dependent oxidoreductase n=1 Tax=Aeromonas veronii TaxID=654 RepID=UPI0022373663|nr:FAD-binding oxidoreductase [Aeromonas veronii]
MANALLEKLSTLYLTLFTYILKTTENPIKGYYMRFHFNLLTTTAPKLSDFNPNTSYWFKDKPTNESPPLAHDMKVDIAIIGGGYSGLSSAWHLAKANPSLKIAIFEARQVGSGASGRNGGMVLPGTEVMDVKKKS